MERTLNSVGNGYRLGILGDLNGWKGDRTRAGITGAFGVPVENDNGRRVVERGLCVGKTYFKHRSLIRTLDGQGVETVWRLRA